MKMNLDVLIIGAGPAGLFAAETLIRNGIKNVLIVEQGNPIEKRNCPNSKECNCNHCDILEGIGGAGGFSDGKLTLSLSRGTHLKNRFKPFDSKYVKQVENEMLLSSPFPSARFAQIKTPKNIVRNPKLNFVSFPLRYFGTDGIRSAIRNYSTYLEGIGVQISASKKVEQLMLETHPSKKVTGVVAHGTEIPSDKTILATGGSSCHWVANELGRIGIDFKDESADVGIRVETKRAVLQPLIEEVCDFKIQYRDDESGVLLRTFCSCDGGKVVNENYRDLKIRAINGHSDLQKKTEFSNVALIAKITRKIEKLPKKFVLSTARAINRMAEFYPLVQNLCDYVENSYSKTYPHTNKKAREANLTPILPSFLNRAFKDFIVELMTVFPNLLEESVLYAPEIKHFGLDVPIDENWKVQGVDNLYCVGHATGLLNSFVSCAISGIIAAHHIAKGGNA